MTVDSPIVKAHIDGSWQQLEAEARLVRDGCMVEVKALLFDSKDEEMPLRISIGVRKFAELDCLYVNDPSDWLAKQSTTGWSIP